MTCRFFTTYYREKHPERCRELDLCIALNSLSFDKVCVLSQDHSGPGPDDCDWRSIAGRQTYGMILKWIADVAAPDDVSIIANCDIFIPRESAFQIADALQERDLFCLSRYEIHPSGKMTHYKEACSQDVWAFKGAPPEIEANYFFGIPGCENTFARDVAAIGWRVSNPSITIKTVHVHGSRFRTETNSAKHRMPPPYLFVDPVALPLVHA